jgi:hypothetical protein
VVAQAPRRPAKARGSPRYGPLSSKPRASKEYRWGTAPTPSRLYVTEPLPAEPERQVSGAPAPEPTHMANRRRDRARLSGDERRGSLGALGPRYGPLLLIGDRPHEDGDEHAPRFEQQR